MSTPTQRFANRFTVLQIDAIGLGVCAALAAGWFFAGLQPLSRAKAERATLGQALATRSDEAEQVHTLSVEIERRLAATRREVQSTHVQLATADQLTQRVADLTQLAGGHSLRIDEIKPGTPTAARRFVIVPIVVLGSGSFSDCAAYLRTIHERYPDVGLTALNLRGEPDKPERGARFTFDLAWYAAPGAAQSKK